MGGAKHQMQEPDTEWTQNEDSSASSIRSSSRPKTSRGLRKHKTGILSSSANQIEWVLLFRHYFSYKSCPLRSLEWLKPYQFSTSIGETDVKRPTYHQHPESKRSHLDVKINRPVTSVVQYENPPTSSESDQLERSVPDYEVPSNRFTISSPVIRSSNGLPPASTGYGSSRPPNSSLPPPPPMHFGQNEAMRSYSQVNTRSITTNSKLI